VIDLSRFGDSNQRRGFRAVANASAGEAVAHASNGEAVINPSRFRDSSGADHYFAHAAKWPHSLSTSL
jgi:hypothetical protein